MPKQEDFIEQMLIPSGWAARRRLEFVEATLFWVGRINRGDLVSRFEISIPQASADLQAYKQLVGEGVEYDASRKAYVTTDVFRPVLATPSGDRLLLQFAATKQGLVRERDLFVHRVPPFDVVRLPHRPVDTALLRRILRAISERQCIKVRYQSMNREEAVWRQLSPHALGSDQIRWHVRAYCHVDHAFKDFVLGRMLEVGDSEESFIDPTTDVAWHTIVKLVLTAHPKLSDAQRKVIELDYGMIDGKVVLESRQALLFYVLHQLGLEDKREPSAKMQQIVLGNRAEIEMYLRSTY